MKARFLSAARHLNRLPEILRCRKHTPDWRWLTSAYVGLNRELPFHIRFSSGGFDFKEVSDIATFWQIFYRDIYPVKSSDRLIVDAGANIGAFSLYALQNAPSSNIIAIEPAPDSCSRIRSMLRANKLDAKVTLHEAALGEYAGETTIQLDAGGGEYGVLRSMSPDTLRRVRRIILEFHPEAPSSAALDPLKANRFNVTRYQDDGAGYGMAWLENSILSSN